MKCRSFWMILLLCAVMVFAGCTADVPDGAADEAETAPADPITLSGEGAPEYVIVRGDTAKSQETAAAVLIRKYLEKCGVSVKITTDWEKNPVSEYEIVVGSTLRAAAEACEMPDAHVLGEEGYYIKTVGNRVYMEGGSPDATYAAAERFLTEFFGYKGDENTASPVGSVSIAGNYELIEKQQFAVTSMSVNGVALSDFRITWDDSFSQYQIINIAEKIQSYFYKNFGVWMEIDKQKEGTGPAVILSAKSGVKSGYLTVSEKDGNLLFSVESVSGFERGWTYFLKEAMTDLKGDFSFAKNYKYEVDLMQPVYYSEFGAKGDGKTNDIDALIAAHEFANENGLPVKADPGYTYYVSAADKGAVVKTDTDWTGASFIIDDSEVPANKRSVAIFNVNATKATYNIKDTIKTVAKGAAKLDITLPEDSIVVLTEAGTKKYIREGKNQNDGSDQTDIIVVDKNGNIDQNAPVIWEYKNVTSVKVIPMDEKVLTIKGGTFTTIANRLYSADGYFNRGIKINRSNVVVDGITHYVKGELTDHGAPYSGILVISECANITVKNCIFTGHKTYTEVKTTGTVSKGTYDISPSKVINLTFENCKQTTDILNTSYWGIMGSNFCKNITLKNCSFSRFDAHQGVANVTIIGCTLGHQCLNAIGSGLLRVEDTKLYGTSLINLRSDYGSPWEGDVIIKNCTWVPNKGNSVSGTYAIIGGSYTGFWDFGYECYMPKNITIENLHIDDSKATGSYKGVYLFGNITSQNTSENYELKVQMQGYPYHITENVTISGFTSVSGKKWNLSPNTFMFRNVVINDLDAAK